PRRSAFRHAQRRLGAGPLDRPAACLRSPCAQPLDDAPAPEPPPGSPRVPPSAQPMRELQSRLEVALAHRYRIEREVGQGGMATVYLAHDLKHDRKVAIKVLKPELAAVLGAERFLDEIRVTANLQHPNLLPLFDSGEAHSFLYYVMPY